MSAPACFRCGTPCVACSCAPCPKCDLMLCSTCDLAGEHKGLRRDQPLPAHGGPRRCLEPKRVDGVTVCFEEEFRRDYNSYELLPVGEGALALSAAILSCFGVTGL